MHGVNLHNNTEVYKVDYYESHLYSRVYRDPYYYPKASKITLYSAFNRAKLC